MHEYSRDEAVLQMNKWGGAGLAFVFVTDYEGGRFMLSPVEAVNPAEWLYSFRGRGNHSGSTKIGRKVEWSPLFPSFEAYERSFMKVRNALMAGDSYLCNLTCRVPLQTDLSMKEIFLSSAAPYRLWMKDRLVCFSPETFVRISGDGEISSFPMKGTIDASLPAARERLMADPKEAAEHATIVDLIRNDLSIVATHVRVARYRYVDVLQTNRGRLLQTSSKITGQLPEGWRARLGDILFSQLPAGSITGAPKRRTVEIIADAETYDRGFYTGVMGLFDGVSLDSAVMIRFIDKEEGRLFFKAGGGITSRSSCRSEYEEMKAKVYVQLC